MSEASPLGPIDPASVTGADQQNAETERTAPWIVRKLVGSMTGRIVMSSYESLRAAGTSVICLSPWGDSNPIFLPCVRFRDLVVHAVIAGTGGAAAVAAPVMGPVSDIVLDTLGSSLLVEVGMHAGFAASTELANDLVISHGITHALPPPSARLATTHVKTLLATLKYRHTLGDAALGFFRSSVHRDSSLFADVKDYLATEKGWFSPYLFASGRRPVIPRSMKPDVVFCHGPFLEGDYKMGAMLLKESASAIHLCEAAPEPPAAPPASEPPSSPHHQHLLPSLPALSKYLPHTRSRTPSPEPALAPLPAAAQPRRLVVLLLGLAPHRAGLWTSAARPGESALRYALLGGCPALVLPARAGAPLLAWDALTLAQLHALRGELPDEGGGEGGAALRGVVSVLCEYVGLCVDWGRVRLARGDGSVSAEGPEAGAGEGATEEPGEDLLVGEEARRDAVRAALALLVAAAVCSKDSKEVRKEVDADRAGIVIFRIP
ncbi:hypothetical protein DFH11DRAFT_1832287 [Phellopilus nigrolimitatus]|nr:hypothetical protein DFH11DRAFT_1832287 [Phellopilus nigrolimitatus]